MHTSHSLTRIFMVGAYIAFCIRYATRPCKYFQLNAKYFDTAAGIFSKKQIDELIPAEWRLQQSYDDGATLSEYPVFIKPEWSQNAHGVYRADNAAQLQAIRKKINHRGRYLIQQTATEKNEYEIFFLYDHHNPSKPAAITITHAVNKNESIPINSIYNAATEYIDISDSFSTEQLQKLWRLLQRIGDFPIARVSLKADSINELLNSKLHIIEINLFLPMPINLLDARYSQFDIFKLSARHMKLLAWLTKMRARGQKDKPVFIKSILYNRNGWLAKILNRLVENLFK